MNNKHDQLYRQVLQEIEAGTPIVQIAATHDIGCTTIRRWARQHDTPPRRDPHLIRRYGDEMRNLLAAGATVNQVADMIGVSPRTIQRWRKKLDCAAPTTPRLTEQQKQLAQQLLEDGASYSEVARTLGFSRQSIKHRFPGHGWTPAEGCVYRHAKERARKAGINL